MPILTLSLVFIYSLYFYSFLFPLMVFNFIKKIYLEIYKRSYFSLNIIFFIFFDFLCMFIIL